MLGLSDHFVWQRSIFKPLLKNGYSKPVAVLATFLASGLLHEYVLLVTTLHGDYKPKLFYQTLFFMWNGMMVVLEGFLSSRKEAQSMVRILPKPVKTLLVLMTAIPVAHWFLDEYVANDFFGDFIVGYPLIVKI